MGNVYVANGYRNPKSRTNFFGTQLPYNKSNPLQQAFFEDLVLYVAKGNKPLSFVENLWLRHLVLQQCGCVQFLSHYQMVIEVFLNMVEKN
jgi:hypothetical protein